MKRQLRPDFNSVSVQLNNLGISLPDFKEGSSTRKLNQGLKKFGYHYCGRCKKILEINKFIAKNKKRGYFAYCIVCNREKTKSYYIKTGYYHPKKYAKANRDKVNKYYKRYRAKNKGIIEAKAKKRYQDNKKKKNLDNGA